MEKNTWNIIFVALVEDFDGANISDSAIKYGVNKFREDLSSTPYSDFLKVNMLVLDYTKNKDNAFLFTNQNDKNILIQKEIIDFDGYDEKQYISYFKQCKNNGENQKYFVILLGHSNGVLFYDKMPRDEVVKPTNLNSFSTLNFRNAIEKAFPETILDGFLGINCNLQSIETNIIFQNNFKYIIGSQRPLGPKTIFYKTLFTDLINLENNNNKNKNLETELILYNFIYFSFQEYMKVSNLCNKISTFECIKKLTNEDYLEFSLCLTKPSKSMPLVNKLNELANLFNFTNKNKSALQIDDTDILRNATELCYDPSFGDYGDILDAKLFFFKLMENYYPNDIKYQTIIEIIDIIQSIILLNCNSMNNYFYNKAIDDYLKINIPSGLGLFMPEREVSTTFNINKVVAVLYLKIFPNKKTWFLVYENRFTNSMITLQQK